MNYMMPEEMLLSVTMYLSALASGPHCD